VTRLKAGLAIIVTILAISIAAGLFSPYDPLRQDHTAILQSPSLAHPLGTDTLGRDVLTRLAFAGRLSLAIAIGATALTILVGVPLGAAAGYFGGAVDTIIMRIADVLLAFPFALGAIAVMAVMGPGVGNVLFTLAALGWPPIARLTRTQVVNEAAKDYVAAVKAAGGSSWYILRRHLLPNAAGPIAVFSLTGVSTVILTEATLSFLGIGVQLPDPAWGSMLSESVGRFSLAPWLLWGPGGALILACLGFNILGEGWRDRIDSLRRA
jgi:peptide/nickel transport system permease protein